MGVFLDLSSKIVDAVELVLPGVYIISVNRIRYGKPVPMVMTSVKMRPEVYQRYKASRKRLSWLIERGLESVENELADASVAALPQEQVLDVAVVVRLARGGETSAIPPASGSHDPGGNP